MRWDILVTEKGVGSLYAELSARFPEIAEKIEDNRDLPYLQMHALADWFSSLSPGQMPPHVIDRMISFAAWCERQPRTDDARTDIYTVFVVGFLERMFERESTRNLLPRFVPKERMIENAEYLRRWVGEDAYKAALALYPVQT